MRSQLTAEFTDGRGLRDRPWFSPVRCDAVLDCAARPLTLVYAIASQRQRMN
jgi:hypothetical protein